MYGHTNLKSVLVMSTLINIRVYLYVHTKNCPLNWKSLPLWSLVYTSVLFFIKFLPIANYYWALGWLKKEKTQVSICSGLTAYIKMVKWTLICQSQPGRWIGAAASPCYFSIEHPPRKMILQVPLHTTLPQGFMFTIIPEGNSDGSHVPSLPLCVFKNRQAPR